MTFFPSHFSAGVLSEIRLTQSGEGTVKPGEALRLTCTVTGALINQGHGHYWIRQPPGKGLEWLGQIYYSSSTWKTNYAAAFQSRISFSSDASKNEYHLQLNAMAAADTAVYYCARQHTDTVQVWHCTKSGSQGCLACVCCCKSFIHNFRL